MTTATQTPLQIVQGNYDALHLRGSQILDNAAAQQRGLLASEQREYDKLAAAKAELTVRLNELKDSEHRNNVASAVRLQTGDTGPHTSSGLMGAYVTGGETYHRGAQSPSFFRDMSEARSGNGDAIDRLRRNDSESRALGNSGGVGGSSGEFAVPRFLLDDYVKLARAGRVTADRFTKAELPAGYSSIVLPKILTGTTATTQSMQNTAVSQTDLTTGNLTSGITTVAGKQVFSRQIMDQAGVDIDQVILADLAADAARSLDQLVLSGTGAAGQTLGILNVTGVNAITYTQATPNVSGTGGFYAVVNKAIAAVATNRFASPDAILMHPKRWSWVAASFDGQGRPLVSPTGGQFNGVADAGDVTAEGLVGTMAGLPVFVDANIAVNGGAGSNQDYVIVARFSDLMLWETAPVAMTFEAPYADSMSILARLHIYMACLPQRQPKAISIITGSGLVDPVY